MFGSWVWLDLTHVRMYVEQGRMEVAGTGVEGGDHQRRHDGSEGGGAAAEVGRQARVLRYKEKRRTRLFSKTIRYEVRKLNAERRPRMKVSSTHTCPQKKHLCFLPSLPSFLPSFQTLLLFGHKSAVLNLTGTAFLHHSSLGR
jgi:hypothetical protein